MVSSSLLAGVEPASGVPSPDEPEISRDIVARYIRAGIQRCCGSMLPVPGAEGVLDAFWDRFGPRAMVIARYAFDVCNGVWMGAPIGIMRFTASSDPFFAIPVLRLAGEE